MVDYEKERTLEATSTWAVAVVCFVILAISILLEHAIHLLEKFLKKKQKVALVEALEKVKSELMLLGFISLLLTVFQGPISGICVSRKTATSWLPCRDKFKSSLTTEKYGRRLFEFSEFDGVVRRSLATKGNDKCTGKGKYAFVTAYGIHELHVFIFVLAIFHVLYCLTTLTLGNIKMRRWKSWEKETNTYDQEKFRYTRDTSFGRRHLSFWSKSSISTWIVCFFRQFIGSVTRVDYQTLRHGFIKAHLPEGSEMTFDFRKYIQRSLEDDFKVVVGISPVIWLAALLFLLTNTQGSHAHLWLPFLSLIIVLVVGTKLQVIITKLGLRINEKGHVVKGVPVVQPDDELFWFGRPRLLLFLIHFVLFQNAFQLAFFAWGTYEFGFKNCFHQSIADIVIRISMGVIIQVLCSYVTLPLYALVTQMGSSMKPTIFNEHIATAIKHWHHTAKKHTKQSHHSQGTPSISSRPATPVHLLHKHQPRSDGSLHDTERGRWVEMEFANDYSYHDESVTNAERAQHSDLMEEEQPNAPHQPPAQPATADQDETDISFSHYVVRK